MAETATQGHLYALAQIEQTLHIPLPAFIAQVGADSEALDVDSARDNQDQFEALARVIAKREEDEELARRLAIVSLTAARRIAGLLPSAYDVSDSETFTPKQRTHYRYVREVTDEQFAKLCSGNRIPTFHALWNLGKPKKPRKPRAPKPDAAPKVEPTKAWVFKTVEEFTPASQPEGLPEPEDTQAHHDKVFSAVDELKVSCDTVHDLAYRHNCTGDVAALIDLARFALEQAVAIAGEVVA